MTSKLPCEAKNPKIIKGETEYPKSPLVQQFYIIMYDITLLYILCVTLLYIILLLCVVLLYIIMCAIILLYIVMCGIMLLYVVICGIITIVFCYLCNYIIIIISSSPFNLKTQLQTASLVYSVKD